MFLFCILVLFLLCAIGINWTKYSRMDKVKFGGRQPLKNLKAYGLLKQTNFALNFKGCLT